MKKSDMESHYARLIIGSRSEPYRQYPCLIANIAIYTTEQSVKRCKLQSNVGLTHAHAVAQ